MIRSKPHCVGRRRLLVGLAIVPLLARAQRSVRAQEAVSFSAELTSRYWFGRLSGPWGVAADGAGSLYVTDARSSGLLRRAIDGSATQLIAGGGAGAGRLRRPQGVAVAPNGEVFVVDGGNRRIQVFGPDGAVRRAWGRRGGSPGEFNAPRGIALDSDGFVYVADGFNDRIQKFAADGTFVTTWGNRGRGPGQFSTPTGIAVGPSGTVYVADTFRDRIQAFTRDGAFVRVVVQAPALRNPIGIGVDLAERIYVTEDVDHRVVIFDADGSRLGGFGGEGVAAGRFRFPRDLDVGEDGVVYVADSFNHQVQAFQTSLPALVPPLDAEDLAIGVALTGPLESPLPHNLADYRVRVSGRLWTIGFRSFYESTGGLERWGWPISDPLREDAESVSQYFQRGVMDWAFDGRGGRQIYPRPVWEFIGGGRGGAPDLGVESDVISDQPGDVVGDWGHRVSNFAIDGTEIGFKDFFDRLGGRPMFGAPRTDARLDTDLSGTVLDPTAPRGVIRQYFQNAVFEYVAAAVQPVRLRLLGDELRNRRYPDGAWRTLTPFARNEPISKAQQIRFPRL